jgi:hypothetical protein
MGMLFWNTVGLIVGWGKANERSEWNSSFLYFSLFSLFSIEY